MKRIEERFDIVVVGGGMAGFCAAIAAAREGSQVALVHNRPVLGGNASSEIRMHIVGADYHGTRPDARETGILEEILLENKHRNPENSWPIFDALLWEKAAFQENLSLFLNTHIAKVKMEGPRICSVSGIQQNTEKQFKLDADVFVDATGDGMLAALSGADTTLGREGKSIYHEPHAPEVSDHYTMGNSLMLKARDMGHPVPFHCPFWSNRYTEEDMQNRGHEEISSGYWCIIDSGADHADLTEEYAAIPGELKQVSAFFDKEVLRDIPEADFFAALPELRHRVPDRAILRAIHFYQENKRVQRQAQALREGDFDTFLKLVSESSRSSWMYLQNITPAGATEHQDVAVALAHCDTLLQGRGAYRVHGGGFAGTVQAFVPLDMLDSFKIGIEKALGEGKCHVLSIRPQGGIREV